MQQRPKIKIVYTAFDKAFELLGWVSLLAIWLLPLFYYPLLPESIATHFGADGKADGFGGSLSIITLPLIATVVFAGLSIINKFPHTFNYPVAITLENAERQYRNATRMIRYLKFIIVFMFGFINYKTILLALQKTEGLGIWFLPAFLCLIFIPVIYYLVKSIRSKKMA